MNDKSLTFASGDWIVHSGHGIGKIVAIEEKSLGNNKEKPYYRIETEDITLWVPVEDDNLLRRVTPPEDFEKAVAVLERPSKRMSSTYQSRLARIRKAQAKGTPRALAQVLRDLWISEFLAEWSVSVGIKKSKVRKKLYSLLRQNALPAANT